jgi:phosphoglycerol transferase MdoB-like AlkP superfamily enzyme
MTDPSRRAPLPRNLIFFVALLGLLCAHFALLRAGLMLRNHAAAGSASAAELAGAFARGLRFDFATACYLVLPFAIAAHIPGIAFDRSPRHRKVFFALFLAVMAALTFTCLAEYEFFHEFQVRFNQLAVQYLNQPTTVAGMVWYGYPVVRYVLAWIALTALFGAAMWLLLRWSYAGLATDRRPATRRQAIGEIGAIGALMAVLVLGMRGGLQSEPLRWGDAFRSDNEFANQAALNGLFTLGHTIKDALSRNDVSAPWVKGMEPEAARAIARRLVVEPDEMLVDPAARTVLRRDRAVNNWLTLKSPGAGGGRPPNVVLVLMESFSARFVGAVGAPPDQAFTPAFDALARDGVLFTRAFSSGTHTHQGVFSSVLGFPNLPGYEYLMENFAGNQSFSALPQILHDRGYQTMFLYNGNLAWDNMEGFLRKQGVDAFVGGKDFPPTVKQDRVWGVADKDLFDRANQEFEQADKSGPFFGIVLTLSNHAPFDVPEPLAFERTTTMGELNRRIDALRYADWSVGQFVEGAKKLDYFDNTLFVFVGDHGFHIEPKLTATNLLYHHVPLLFYAPELMAQRGVALPTVVNHVNIAPSILGLLGVGSDRAHWARNVFSRDFADGNFAVFKGSGGDPSVGIARGDELLVIDDNGKSQLYRYDLGFPPSVHPQKEPETAPLASELETEARGYIQAALGDLLNRTAGPLPPNAPEPAAISATAD